ncbi:MAG: ester cyclase [Selenomonadaceae bacterium]|nr:ester cyclase [Selenomonadaceae bacterium]MBQ7630849.1 ester cyclase [Selenomonadaceae bacterium]
MSAIERNKENILLFKDCINNNDKILAAQLIDDKAEFTSLTSPEKLYGGAGYLSVVEFMRKSFSDIHWEIVDMAAEADKVAVSWICSGTHDGEFMGLPATGKKFSFSCMNFYYFNDAGKIINDVAAKGLAGLFEALGILK